MTISTDDMIMLCRLCGVLETDAAAVAKLGFCYERAVNWYLQGGALQANPAFKHWAMDLACWFHDNIGASDAQIPPYIVSSIHQLRVIDETEGSGNGAI